MVEASGLLVLAGAVLAALWGVGHLAPTRAMVKGFEPVSEDNRLIITMEWLIEGVALIMAGVIVGVVTWVGGPDDPVSIAVYAAVAAMLLIFAAVTVVTGARTKLLPLRLCPIVKSSAAGLILAGAYLGTL